MPCKIPFGKKVGYRICFLGDVPVEFMVIHYEIVGSSVYLYMFNCEHLDIVIQKTSFL